MGREWYWSRSTRSTTRRREEEEEGRRVPERSPPPPPAGCMSGVLHLLQFRQLLLFPSHQPHHRRQRRPPHDQLPTVTRVADRSLRGFRGVHARSSQPIRRDQLGRRGGDHHKFATLVAGAGRDGGDSGSSVRLAGKAAGGAGAAAVLVAATSPETRKEKPWLEDVVGSYSFQAGETPRTSNVVARLMGLDELPARVPDATPRRPFHPPPAPQPSSPKTRRHDHQKENNGKQQQQQHLVAGRRPLSAKNYNVVFETEGASRSLPATPRMSCSGRRSCDGETPARLSLQLDAPVMEEFDFLCEVVPERRQPRRSASSGNPSSCSSTANRDPARLPQFRGDGRTRAAAGSGADQHHQRRAPGAGKRTGGGTRHENKKSRRSPPSPPCSELDVETTLETKRVVADAAAVVHPRPVPLSSSSPSLENRVGDQGKKKVSSRMPAKPGVERFNEKLRRPPPEKPAGRSRRTSAPRSLSAVQSKSQLPSPKPAAQSPSPPPRRPPAVRSPAARLSEEPAAVSRQISPSTLHGGAEQGSRSRRRRRPDHEDDSEFRYVRMILECAGVVNCCRTRGGGGGGRRASALARWHSPSHPIDPAVFYRLELFLPDEEEEDELRRLGRLRHRSNRKLLFHLVEEILADILRRSDANPRWRSRYRAAGDMTAAAVMEEEDGGEALLKQVWSCVRRIRPAGPVRDMRDVDDLIAGLGSTEADAVGRLNPRHRAIGEEVDAVAAVVEDGIFTSLVEELKAL